MVLYESRTDGPQINALIIRERGITGSSIKTKEIDEPNIYKTFHCTSIHAANDPI